VMVNILATNMTLPESPVIVPESIVLISPIHTRVVKLTPCSEFVTHTSNDMMLMISAVASARHPIIARVPRDMRLSNMYLSLLLFMNIERPLLAAGFRMQNKNTIS